MIFKHYRAVPLLRRLVNALSEETGVRSWANPCQICGGHSDSRTGFLRVMCSLCQNGKRVHPGNRQIRKFCARKREHAVTFSKRREVICMNVVPSVPLANLPHQI